MPIQPYPIWDYNFIVFLQQQLGFLAIFMQWVSIILSPPVIIIFAALIYFFHKPKGFKALVFLAFITIVVLSLKDILHHPRPFFVSPQIKAFITPLDYGMPSGHAMFGAFFIFLGVLFKRFSFFGLGLAGFVLVSLSRMVLGVHFFSQILMGLLLAVVIGFLVEVMFYIRDWLFQFKILNSFKKQQYAIFLLGLITLTLFGLAYLYWGLYFTPRQEWVAMVAQVSDKPIHSINFKSIGASIVFGFSLILFLRQEQYILHFKPGVLSISSFKSLLLLGGVTLVHLLLSAMIFCIFYLIHPTLAFIVLAGLLPYLFCYTLVLEACLLGVLIPEKTITESYKKRSFAYWLGRYCDR